MRTWMVAELGKSESKSESKSNGKRKSPGEQDHGERTKKQKTLTGCYLFRKHNNEKYASGTYLRRNVEVFIKNLMVGLYQNDKTPLEKTDKSRLLLVKGKTEELLTTRMLFEMALKLSDYELPEGTDEDQMVKLVQATAELTIENDIRWNMRVWRNMKAKINFDFAVLVKRFKDDITKYSTIQPSTSTQLHGMLTESHSKYHEEQLASAQHSKKYVVVVVIYVVTH